MPVQERLRSTAIRPCAHPCLWRPQSLYAAPIAWLWRRFQLCLAGLSRLASACAGAEVLPLPHSGPADPGADVGGVSPVPAQMWAERPGRGTDVGGMGPRLAAQMRRRVLRRRMSPRSVSACRSAPSQPLSRARSAPLRGLMALRRFGAGSSALCRRALQAEQRGSSAERGAGSKRPRGALPDGRDGYSRVPSCTLTGQRRYYRAGSCTATHWPTQRKVARCGVHGRGTRRFAGALPRQSPPSVREYPQSSRASLCRYSCRVAVNPAECKERRCKLPPPTGPAQSTVLPRRQRPLAAFAFGARPCAWLYRRFLVSRAPRLHEATHRPGCPCRRI
jgi:hypothetical protein